LDMLDSLARLQEPDKAQESPRAPTEVDSLSP
jgi:hypothetical protein